MAQATNLRDFIIASQTERPDLWPDLDYVPPAHVEPLIGLWQERQAAKAAADAITRQMDEEGKGSWVGLERHRQPWWDRQWALEYQIAETAPVSPEGLAIVATVQLVWSDELPDREDPEIEAGRTIASYILANTPADVLQRAGLEVRS